MLNVLDFAKFKQSIEFGLGIFEWIMVDFIVFDKVSEASGTVCLAGEHISQIFLAVIMTCTCLKSLTNTVKLLRQICKISRVA